MSSSHCLPHFATDEGQLRLDYCYEILKAENLLPQGTALACHICYFLIEGLSCCLISVIFQAVDASLCLHGYLSGHS